MSTPDQTVEHRATTEQRSGPDGGNRFLTLRNGLVGGVVAVLLSFLPLSTILGGGVAGYLEGDDGRTGTYAGAVAGVVAFVPYLVVAVYLGLSPTVVLPGPELGLSPSVVLAGVTAFTFVYAVGLSVLGSLLGAHLNDG